MDIVLTTRLMRTKISRRIESSVKMAIAATEVVIDGYYWGELSSEHLRTIFLWSESSLTTLSQKVLTLSKS